MHEKWNLPWIFEIATNFHHFLHGFWKFFRGVFRCVFRPCVFEKVPLLQSAACQDTMVFTMDSNDFHVLHFSGHGQKIRDSGVEYRCKKPSKFWPEIPRKSDAKNHGISVKKSTNFHENLHFSQENLKI